MQSCHCAPTPQSPPATPDILGRSWLKCDCPRKPELGAPKADDGGSSKIAWAGAEGKDNLSQSI
ncbi:Bifunctional inhibitor/lipid-transfer protein/seed storage 2S albumin superfamily protein [Prunus dulcis]|uniref:Bifunctional inhibitor/lipid-transfer protein/seed storage 2S albumin superfamily protein n=1 Tax=Prunus dulcis TaxID=3755 RepID=A0A4Y1RH00_PRUDU|nr:Bifunctional inhibitor/lipid-transfer protein/seed storage 2S albumin superfamily protein [Prunus dulcis]